MGSTPFSVFVRGLPAPQGSKRAFRVGDRAVVVDNNPKSLKDWRSAIGFVLQQHWVYPPLTGPVAVTLRFQLPKPKSAPKKRKHPALRPDLDKLVRAALDSMTGICIKDDALVVEITATKVYDETPGLRLELAEVGYDA